MNGSLFISTYFFSLTPFTYLANFLLMATNYYPLTMLTSYLIIYMNLIASTWSCSCKSH